MGYQELLRALWSASHPSYLRPIGFMQALRETVQGTPYESFGRGAPNDAHEFLVFLLDHFHEALAKGGSTTSEVVNLFFGQMQRTIECGGCHRRHSHREPFNCLKIGCPPNAASATLDDWIRQELKETTTLSDYRCETCASKQTATLMSDVWTLPRNVFLMIRRFRPDGQKDMTPCPSPGEFISFDSVYSPDSTDPHRSARYEVRGIVDHHGTHRGGHYTAQIKHQLSNVWWHYNDASTTALAGPGYGPSTYLLYLVRS